LAVISSPVNPVNAGDVITIPDISGYKTLYVIWGYDNKRLKTMQIDIPYALSSTKVQWFDKISTSEGTTYISLNFVVEATRITIVYAEHGSTSWIRNPGITMAYAKK